MLGLVQVILGNASPAPSTHIAFAITAFLPGVRERIPPDAILSPGVAEPESGTPETP